MQGDIPQVPQEVQSEAKGISQTPQQPPVIPQTPPKQNPPIKPKKGLKLKILIILITLVGLTAGGFFIWKNISAPKVKYKGLWMPTLLFRDPNYLTSNVQKLKDMGINTIYIAAFPPFPEATFEKLKEIFPPGIVEMFKELIPIEEELIIANIQTAHRNDLKVALAVVKPPALEEKDIDALNSKIIEYARLAEEYDVELFAPIAEPPGTIDTGNWRQEILSRIKEVYHGEVFWSGFVPDLHDKETISQIAEQPPGNLVGYDYIGFSTLFFPSERLDPEEQLRWADRLTLEGYSQHVEGAIDYVLAQAERDGVKGVIITEFGVIGTIAMSESSILSLSEEEIAIAHEIVLEKGKGRVVGFFANSEFLGIELPGIPLLKENLKTEEVIREWFTEILPEKKMISY
jgi:hypothetical protein